MTVDLDVAIRVLRFVTPISATLAFVTVTLGLATSAWLFSEEKIPNPKFNRTGDPDLEFLSKYTASGLWTLCFTNPGESEKHCFNIDYFPREDYSPDPNDSTMSIPYAVLRSAPFFFVAAAMLAAGEVSCFMGHFARRRRYCTFISGVTFIVSGLFLLMGFVVYVSVFTAEIGSKLRPSSSLQPPLFTYTYGYSFQLVVTGFLAVEVAGTSAVFLFIYWHRNRISKKEMHRKMTLALVQTPVELSQANQILPLGSHLTTAVSSNSVDHQPNQRRPNHQQQYYPVGSEVFLDDFPRQRSHSFDSEIRCNGGLALVSKAIGCSSSPNGNDDDSCIPTPPPSVFHALECPIHRSMGRPVPVDPYVTVHNPAREDQYVTPYATLGRKGERSHLNGSGMPDITNAYGPRRYPLQHQQRVSCDMETYRPDRYSMNDRVLRPTGEFSQEICLQCRGAGHVTVSNRPHHSTPSSGLSQSQSFMSRSGHLSRDLTANTICTTVDMESPSDRIEKIDSPPMDRRPRLPSHYGSLRRITAV